jgi:hypothetical protein
LVPLDRPRKKDLLLVRITVCIEKIRQSTALFWFVLRDVGILQIFYSQAVIQRAKFVDSPSFLKHGLGLCPYKS